MRTQWPRSSSLSYVCADAMGIALLLLLYTHREGNRRPAIYPLIAWIGLYSYGSYLWHLPVIAPVMSASHRFPGWLGTMWITCEPALLGISLGVAATKAVEFSALALRDRLFPRRVDSAVGIPAEERRKWICRRARFDLGRLRLCSDSVSCIY
jgi:peptidoglycan/LPS O-acetylase OafA/YrhL